jgi:hypothetical protein
LVWLWDSRSPFFLHHLILSLTLDDSRPFGYHVQLSPTRVRAYAPPFYFFANAIFGIPLCSCGLALGFSLALFGSLLLDSRKPALQLALPSFLHLRLFWYGSETRVLPVSILIFCSFTFFDIMFNSRRLAAPWFFGICRFGHRV